MFKANRKFISIIITLAMLVGMMVPFAGSALATSTYSVDGVKSFDNSVNQTVSTNEVEIKIVRPGGATGTSIIELIDGDGDVVPITQLDITAYIGVDTTYGVDVNVYEEDGTTLYTPGTFMSSNNDKMSIEINDTDSPSTDVYLRIKVSFNGLNLGDGDVKLNFYKNTGSLLSGGSLIVATSGGGNVVVSTLGSPKNVGEGTHDISLRLEEKIAGAFALSSASRDYIKLRLPKGVTWVSDGSGASRVKGDIDNVNISWEVQNDRRVLHVFNPQYASTSASIIDIKTQIQIDEDDANFGDVVVSITGNGITKASPSDVILAVYSEFGGEITIDEVKDIVAGKFEDNELNITGKIKIREAVDNSFVTNRTISMTLPSWVKVKDGTDAVESVTSSGSFLNTSSVVGGTNKIKITTSTPNPTGTRDWVEFKAVLSVEADRTGDIEASFSGAGISEQKVVIAKAIAPVTLESSNKDVKIGIQNQAASDIILTETVKESWKSGYALEVWMTEPGARFVGTPDVEVIEGDVDIETNDVEIDDGVLLIPIKSSSSKPSTIKISNVKATLDRTVPEGPLAVKVGGDAIIENSRNSGSSWTPTSDISFNKDFAVKQDYVTVITPAPGEVSIESSFTIGELGYTMNNQRYTSDAAPFITNGRTMIPMRYAAYSLGITNIFWDGTSATFMSNNNTTVQVTPGSNIMKVNGVDVLMDVACEMIDGRVFVPYRAIAQAFGADVDFEESTQTVIMRLDFTGNKVGGTLQ